MRVEHTCEVNYGSYNGISKVVCDADDDLDIVKAKVKKQEKLNFLAMASYSVKIINTHYLPEY